MAGDVVGGKPERQDLMLMRKMLESLEKTNNRLDQHDQKIEQLQSVVENDVFITCRQAVLLQDVVAQRVRQFLAEVGLEYQNHSKRMFSAVWRDLKKEMGVPSYREIPRKKIGTAVRFVTEWVPTQMPEAKAG